MTVHDTPGIRTVMRWLALAVYRLGGWKTHGVKPPLNKYVIIAAPHTSNWDFLYTVCLAFIYRLTPCIMMKAEWFFWPLGGFFRWLGAMPIDRSKANNVVGQSIAAFGRRESLVLVVPPAGTRRRVTHWKTGFYHIAQGAGVPIALGFLDYPSKTGGFGPLIDPSGDMQADMAAIQRFYRHIRGKNAGAASRSASLSDLKNTE
jgi:1-acyl-sn-glycerol-3-phosphate acyltransferase